MIESLKDKSKIPKNKRKSSTDYRIIVFFYPKDYNHYGKEKGVDKPILIFQVKVGKFIKKLRHASLYNITHIQTDIGLRIS